MSIHLPSPGEQPRSSAASQRHSPYKQTGSRSPSSEPLIALTSLSPVTTEKLQTLRQLAVDAGRRACPFSHVHGQINMFSLVTGKRFMP